MMHILSFYSCFLFITVMTVQAQQHQGIRFKDKVFSVVRVDKNISYQYEASTVIKKKYYLFDLYEPENDTCASRPLILWMHGGGFKFGNKTSRGTPVWSRGFAERGYVCAAVNYRLSNKNTLSDIGTLINACANAVEDIYTAITYFRKNHLLYKIDTNRIILAGNSAGGMIALQAVYSNPSMMRALVQNEIKDSDKSVNRENIAAVINFWGGMFNIEWLKNTSVPIVSVHGSKDKIVPPSQPDNRIFGSVLIHQYADREHITNRLKIYDGYAHELQKRFNPFWAGKATHNRLKEAGGFAAAFLYDELFATEVN